MNFATKAHQRWQRMKTWWTTRFLYTRMFGRIGPRCRIAPPLYVHHPERVVIGSGVAIGPGCRIEAFPPPLRSKKPIPMLEIGDRVRIGGHVRLSCCTSLTVGDGALIEDGCLITDCEYGGAPDGMAYYRQPKTGRPTAIGDGAWIGAGTVVLAGSRIGSRAVILPGSVVTGEIPPRSMAGGSPAEVVRVYDAGRRTWLPVSVSGNDPVDVPGHASVTASGNDPGNSPVNAPSNAQVRTKGIVPADPSAGAPANGSGNAPANIPDATPGHAALSAVRLPRDADADGPGIPIA